MEPKATGPVPGRSTSSRTTADPATVAAYKRRVAKLAPTRDADLAALAAKLGF